MTCEEAHLWSSSGDSVELYDGNVVPVNRRLPPLNRETHQNLAKHKSGVPRATGEPMLIVLPRAQS